MIRRTLTVALMLSVLALSGCLGAGADGKPTLIAPNGAVVTYTVTGEGTATVSYLKAGPTTEMGEQSLPFTYTFTAFNAPGQAMVMVQKNDGPVSCEVAIGGVVVSAQSAEGPLALVTCSG